MSIFVYGDSGTKEISTITRQQLVGDSRVEIVLSDGHALGEELDPYSSYRINDTDDDVVEEKRVPKIKGLAKEEASHKHFHNLDYKRELSQSLYPKRTMVQGEIQLVEWYSDSALTDLVLKVEISYNRDSLGFAIDRTTTRTWINEDGTEQADTKVTHKRYDINPYEQLEEGQRRRTNLANNLSLQVLGGMVAALSGTHTAEQATQLGRDFLLQHSVAWAEFVKSSHQQILTDVALPDATHDVWLDLEISPGLTFRDHIIAELTLY